jgi:hypothetical protein
LKYILAIFNAASEGRCMMGYSKALCSILGTLLSLALVTSPTLAQGKKKKKAAEEAPAAEAEVEASGGGSLDSLMESAAEKKKDDKKKKGKKGEEEAPAEEAEAPPAEEVVEEPDAWERPPEEEKAPSKPEAAPVDTTPPIERPISVALLLGYGVKTDRQTGGLGADPYGLTAGVRGGYTFDFRLYAGVYFNYYLGSTESGTNDRFNSTETETSASYMQFGAEVGYDVEAGPVMFRPSLQIGMAIALTDKTTTTTSVNDLMFGPGITLLYPMDEFFIGLDLRAALVMGDGVSAFVPALTAGMTF